MIVVVPGRMPDTTPDALTDPILGVLLLHEPPGVASLSEVVVPAQRLAVPRIAVGNGFTVTSV